MVIGYMLEFDELWLKLFEKLSLGAPYMPRTYGGLKGFMSFSICLRV